METIKTMKAIKIAGNGRTRSLFISVSKEQAREKITCVMPATLLSIVPGKQAHPPETREIFFSMRTEISSRNLRREKRNIALSHELDAHGSMNHTHRLYCRSTVEYSSTPEHLLHLICRITHDRIAECS